MKIALVIGRFQPTGNQHIDLFNQIIEYNSKLDEKEKFEMLCVGIGTNGKIDDNNMFSAKQSMDMITPIVEKAAEDMDIEHNIVIVPDINSDERYSTYVAEKFEFDLESNSITLFSENPWTIACFEDKEGYQVEIAKERVKMHSTTIRDMIRKGEDYSSLVPKHVLEYIQNRVHN